MRRRRPARGSCKKCSRPLDPFGRCRRRTCPGYRDLWAGDWRVCLTANVAPLQGVLLVTITAPGTDTGLVWDPDHCSHPPTERCSGPKGCRVLKAAADRWHLDHQERAARLHRASAGRARRHSGAGPIIAAKAWERQERGLDHLHLIVPYSTPRERARADVYVRSLKELAPRYWFGFVDASKAWAGDRGGARAAGYCAKYIGKATSVDDAPRVRRPVFIGQHLTRETGMTMRQARWRRYAYNCWRRGDAIDVRSILHFFTEEKPSPELLRLCPYAITRSAPPPNSEP